MILMRPTPLLTLRIKLFSIATTNIIQNIELALILILAMFVCN